MLEQLVGMQAQAPKSPFVGLWTRLAGFSVDDLADLIVQRKAVRLPLMRSTIHLVSARDCLALRPVIQPVMDRDLSGSSWGKGVVGVDLARLGLEARRILEKKPLANGDLGRALTQRWRKRDPGSLAYAARNTLALVQIPPRGLWHESGRPLLAPAESWLSRPLGDDASPDDMIDRYLRAFGPATVADVQQWSGLTGLGSSLDRMRPELRTFVDERGRELFDVAEAPLPDPETPAPVRYLPEFDNLLLSHSDRARIIPPEYRAQVVRNLGAKMFLVDGFVAGEWKIDRSRKMIALDVHSFAPPSRKTRAALVQEGRKLLTFVSGESGGEVRIRERV